MLLSQVAHKDSLGRSDAFSEALADEHLRGPPGSYIALLLKLESLRLLTKHRYAAGTTSVPRSVMSLAHRA
jgi:hypothetical protein